jgi:signal transduction histidine kinase
MKRRVEKGDYRIERYIDGASDAASKAAALTHRLLAFGRQQPLAPKPIDANQLVAGTSDLLRRTLGDVQLQVALTPDLWLANVDPNQLENAIINLAVNGRDAMPEGGTLTIETANAVLDETYASEHAEVTAGEYVMISVSDTGIGMTPEVVARAFDPFFTTKEIGKGTGLGLSQVFGFLKQSGGHVKIYSELGVGTSVKMYLPRSDVTARDYVAPNAGSSERAAVERTNLTVLVVEDESRMREVAVDALSELGYKVLQAENARIALQILDQHPEVALLFTDVIMPETNGRQLA